MQRAAQVDLHHCPFCKHGQLVWFAAPQCVKTPQAGRRWQPSHRK